MDHNNSTLALLITYALLHLVKLVNAADAHVSKHQGTPLQNKLVGDGVAGNGSGETDAGATSSRCVHATRGEVRHLLQQLAFGHSGITHEKNVDVATDLEAVCHFAVNAAHQQEQEGLFDIVMTPDLGRDGAGELVVHLLHIKEGVVMD